MTDFVEEKLEIFKVWKTPVEEEIKRLSRAVDAYPPAFSGNPLNLLFLENAHPIPSGLDYLRLLDGTGLLEERREFLLRGGDKWPFPTIRIDKRPDPWDVSTALFEHYDHALRVLQSQRDIGLTLRNRAISRGIDIVVLMIVDGLSYYDLASEAKAEPCLVNGVTITEYGYREVIGKPSISAHFFNAGYKQQLALTFFEKDGSPLAEELYGMFGSSQVHRINSMDEGLDLLRNLQLRRAYVQIAAPGLDRLCHYHPDRPPIAEYVRRIMEKFDQVGNLFEESGQRVMTCLTADHGIMWRDAVEARTVVVNDLLPEDTSHPRYVKGSLCRSFARVVDCAGQSFTLMKAPCMARRWKHAEWGVHGGISAWESIVPLIIREY